mgnify:CR=1 FL=1
MNYKFKTSPYRHQLTALERSWNKESFAYFMEMGTGKTKVLIDNVAMLYDKGRIDGALIVALKELYQLGINKNFRLTYQTILKMWQYCGKPISIKNNKRN